jgi:hypothetical protein
MEGWTQHTPPIWEAEDPQVAGEQCLRFPNERRLVDDGRCYVCRLLHVRRRYDVLSEQDHHLGPTDGNGASRSM